MKYIYRVTAPRLCLNAWGYFTEKCWRPVTSVNIYVCFSYTPCACPVAIERSAGRVFETPLIYTISGFVGVYRMNTGKCNVAFRAARPCAARVPVFKAIFTLCVRTRPSVICRLFRSPILSIFTPAVHPFSAADGARAVRIARYRRSVDRKRRSRNLAAVTHGARRLRRHCVFPLRVSGPDVDSGGRPSSGEREEEK